MLELKTRSHSGATNWLELTESLGQQFVASEIIADRSDRFVSENFAILRNSNLLAIGVPEALGGSGASHADICQILSVLGRYSSSTALAFAMHTHQIMVTTWKWQQNHTAGADLLRRVADERLILLSSGGGDWLKGSGSAIPTDGGFLINARKTFVSGAPAGDLLITSAVYEDPENGATVLHFAVPMDAPGVSIASTWKAMGMKGTGSHNVLLENVFVPDHAIALRRTANKWHPAFHVVTMLAIPIIYSVYVGIAEAARNLVVQVVTKHRDDNHTCYMVGKLENALAAAKFPLQQMIAIAAAGQPGFDTTNQIMTGRTLVAQAVLDVVDLAMEIAGGIAFHRPFGLEKLFRDAQGVRYHPMRVEVQCKLSGQLALGYDPDSL